MGLDINTNISRLATIGQLRRNDQAIARVLQKLGSGREINTASDDPSGFVVSERFRSRLASLHQAVENSQNAANVVGTAQASANEVGSLLRDIRGSIVSALGASSSGQVDAEQASIDNALASIDRISATTSFADRKLIDGSAEIGTETVGSGIRDVSVNAVQLDGVAAASIDIQLESAATRGGDVFASGDASVAFRSASSDVVLRISGSRGSQDITLASGAGSAALQSAVNATTGTTGLFASGGRLFSAEFGASEAVSVEVVSGSITVGDGSTTVEAGATFESSGQDAVATVNGVEAAASGNTLTVETASFSGTIVLDDNVTSSSDLSLRVKDGGLTFQLDTGADVSNRAQIGIAELSTSALGSDPRTLPGQGGAESTIGGLLTSLRSGGANDLRSNPSNALRIVDEAIEQVAREQARLGAFEKNTLQSNISSLSVASENLASSLSDVSDLDFAEETARLLRERVLFESGVAVLGQSDQLATSLLGLLRA